HTPEILDLAHSCIAVSGSVGLELLYRNKPAVVVYRVPAVLLRLIWIFKKRRYLSLVNFLAEKKLFPRELDCRCETETDAGHVLRWLSDENAYRVLREELAGLRNRVAKPGACERAAQVILGTEKEGFQRLSA